MRTRKLLRQIAVFTVLLIQATVGSVLPWADARAESAPQHERAHVQGAESQLPCPPGHDHQLCQLCRVLGTHAAETPVAVGPRPIRESVVRAPALVATTLRACQTSSLGPRAPPPFAIA